MDILKTALDWAKAEAFSTSFFILFGIMFVAASIGFWQLGKTDIARAYIFPTLVAGILLLTIGTGLFISNNSRMKSFPALYNKDATAFVQSELQRVEKTMDEYQTVALKVFPVIIAVAALMIVFVDKPLWRAISITLIAMLVVIMLIDSNANARLDVYKKQLEKIEIIN